MSGAVRQSGAITPLHAGAWLDNGVLQDGGPASAGKLFELGITNASGAPALGINNGPITTEYAAFTITVSPAGVVTLGANSFNGANPAALQFVVNGVAIPVTAGAGDVVGPSSSVNGHAAIFSGTTGLLIADAGAAPVLNTPSTISSALLSWLQSLPSAPQVTPGWWSNSGAPTYW